MIRVLLLGLCLSAAAWGADPHCTATAPKDSVCVLALEALRPTQSAVGRLQVEQDQQYLRQQPDLPAWQRKKPIPVVIDEAGRFFMTDRHHTAYALWLAGQAQVTVRVIERLERPAQFWAEMAARHWVYLYDEQGQPICPAALPARVADLRDDPYRSLAGLARNRGQFKGTEAYFMEFEWARYFGRALDWQPVTAANLDALLQQTGRLACEPAAMPLPGYDAAACAARAPAR